VSVTSPILTSLSSLGLDINFGEGSHVGIYTMLVSSDTKILYLGLGFSEDPLQKNLVVIQLDDNGKPLGDPEFFQTGPDTGPFEKLPVGYQVHIEFLYIDETYKKLYACQRTHVLVNNNSSYLNIISVYDLDHDGLPTTRKTYAFFEPGGHFSNVSPPYGTPPYINTIVKHPNNQVIYMSGDDVPYIFKMILDQNGNIKVGDSQEQLFYSLHTQTGKEKLAIHPNGRKMYIGTFPYVLEIIDLDPNGNFTGHQDSSHNFIDEVVIQAQDKILSFLSSFPQDLGNPTDDRKYLNFHIRDGALYILPTPTISGATNLNGTRISNNSHKPLDPPVWPLLIWPLDNNGNPATVSNIVKIQDENGVDIIGRNLIVNPSDNRIWILADHNFNDAYTNESVLDGFFAQEFEINITNQIPSASRRRDYPIIYRQLGVLGGIGASSRIPVFLSNDLKIKEDANQVKGWFLKVKVLEARLITGEPLQRFSLLFYETLSQAVTVTGGNLIDNIDITSSPTSTYPTSRKFALDDYLKNKSGQQFFLVGVNVKDRFERLTIELLVFPGDPDSPDNITSLPKNHGIVLNSTVQGNHIAFLLPGYGFYEPNLRETAFEYMTEHSLKYFTAARNAAQMAQSKIPLAKRPEEFIIPCFALYGGQASIVQLRNQVQAMALLGINSIADEYWQGIPLDIFANTLESNAMTFHTRAVAYPLQYINGGPPYTFPDPPSLRQPHWPEFPQWLLYFDFYLSKHQEDLNNWARLRALDAITENGGHIYDVVNFHLNDEPGWWYGDIKHSELLTPNPNTGLTTFDHNDFDNFLVSNGQSSFIGNFPIIEFSNSFSLNQKKLFYWSLRYFVERFAEGHARAAKAIEQALGYPPKLNVNLNLNAYNYWHRNTADGQLIGLGRPDWMTLGRQKTTVLGLYTESEASPLGQRALQQIWSVFGDLLRSACMLGNKQFGGNVKPFRYGSHTSGATYQILSLIGRGGKYIELYAFGPDFLFALNSWSEIFSLYQQIADALYLVGRAEHLLFPGKPLRGKVAILWPGSNHLWENDDNFKLYEYEIFWIHFALTHANYAVDFVDDTDIDNDELLKRGYKVLYVVGPNVSFSAQKKIRDWIQNTLNVILVVMPGAAVADEYNEVKDESDNSTAIIDSVLGLSDGSRSGMPRYLYGDPIVSKGSAVPLTVTSPGRILGFPPLAEVVGPTQTLRAPPTQVLGQIGADTVLSMKTFTDANGNRNGGRAIAFGFFPGLQYWHNDHIRDNPSGLPSEEYWDVAARNIIVRPARLAFTPQDISLNEEMVESCPLYSEKGIAIVFLNWSGKRKENLAIKINNTIPINRIPEGSRIYSAKGSTVTPNTSSSQLSPFEIKLALLEYVDILMIEFP
jgi:hypothetical protein